MKDIFNYAIGVTIENAFLKGILMTVIGVRVYKKYKERKAEE